jgi:hypothetical protein
MRLSRRHNHQGGGEGRSYETFSKTLSSDMVGISKIVYHLRKKRDGA